MPAGVTWPKYLKVSFACYLSMFAGSQLVHAIYRPLDDLDDLVEKEKERMLKEKGMGEQEKTNT